MFSRDFERGGPPRIHVSDDRFPQISQKDFWTSTTERTSADRALRVNLTGRPCQDPRKRRSRPTAATGKSSSCSWYI